MKILMLFHDEPQIRHYLRHEVIPGDRVSVIHTYPYRIEHEDGSMIYLGTAQNTEEVERFRGVRYDMIDTSNMRMLATSEFRAVFANSLMR